MALNPRATEIASAEKSLLARIRDDAARVVMKAHPVQRRIEEFFVARLKAHQVIRRFSNESLRETSMHLCLQKEDIAHGTVPSAGAAHRSPADAWGCCGPVLRPARARLR